MNRDDELTSEEKRAFEGLAGGPEPPARLEDAVVDRLSRQGLIANPGTSWARWALAAAAGVALFAAGLALGQRRSAPAADAGPPAGVTRYALLLYNAPDEPALSDTEMAARVDEYRNWAIGLRQSGSDISGEKLASRNLDLGSSSALAGSEALGGFFLFSAKDPEAALAIARSCPHLKHGGRAELRPIEET